MLSRVPSLAVASTYKLRNEISKSTPFLKSSIKRRFPWRSQWGAEEPGRLQTIGSLRVRLDWATSLSLFTFMHWRRKWQPTPVFLPGESQGWRSLMGFRLWGRTESDTTEATYSSSSSSDYITSSWRLAGGYSFCPLLMPMSEALSISFIL